MADVYKKSATRDTLESLVVTVILAIFGTTFVVQAFKIPTGSMENTLLIGDHLLVNKFVFAFRSRLLGRLLPYRDVRRGDIVVFKYPSSDDEAQEPGEHFVKRVIGVPGDRIRVDHRQIFINDQQLNEPYVRHAFPTDETHAGDNFPPAPGEYLPGSTLRWNTDIQNYAKAGELVVPPDRYFVMGDNREESWDSRFWGFAPREVVSGRPLLIYWSFETPRSEYQRNALSDRVSQSVDLVVHFFSKTRWRRTFKFVR
jgi:signal peptidase I